MITKYKLQEWEAAMDRDGSRCWLCGAPLLSIASGRAHINAQNVNNLNEYGVFVIDNRKNFRMSCNNCNGYATKYKPDTDGEYLPLPHAGLGFGDYTGIHRADTKIEKRSWIKVSRITEAEKLAILKEIQEDLRKVGLPTTGDRLRKVANAVRRVDAGRKQKVYHREYERKRYQEGARLQSLKRTLAKEEEREKKLQADPRFALLLSIQKMPYENVKIKRIKAEIEKLEEEKRLKKQRKKLDKE